MCLAIFKPAGAIIPLEHLQNGYDGNPDGCGFCYSEGGKLRVVKGMFSFADFYKQFAPKQHLAMLIHFRVGTSGGRNTLNCHPFSICEGKYALIHNGVIPIHRSVEELSDTGNFAKLVMEPMLKAGINPKKPAFTFLVDQALGRGNKVCLMAANGEVTIYNEDEGDTEDALDKDGKEIKYTNGENVKVWYSNGGYRWKRTRVGRTIIHQDEYSGYFDGSPNTEDLATSMGEGFAGHFANRAKLDPPPTGVIDGFKGGIKSAADSAAAMEAAKKSTIRIVLPPKPTTLPIDLGPHKINSVEKGPIFNAKDELEIAYLMEDMRISREKAIEVLDLDVQDAITFVAE